MNPLYQVQNIVERTVMSQNGQFNDVYEITFQTRSGVNSSVQIPKATFTKELAAAEITKKAEELEAVMGLNG